MLRTAPYLGAGSVCSGCFTGKKLVSGQTHLIRALVIGQTHLWPTFVAAETASDATNSVQCCDSCRKLVVSMQNVKYRLDRVLQNATEPNKTDCCGCRKPLSSGRNRRNVSIHLLEIVRKMHLQERVDVQPHLLACDACYRMLVRCSKKNLGNLSRLVRAYITHIEATATNRTPDKPFATDSTKKALTVVGTRVTVADLVGCHNWKLPEDDDDEEVKSSTASELTSSTPTPSVDHHAMYIADSIGDGGWWLSLSGDEVARVKQERPPLSAALAAATVESESSEASTIFSEELFLPATRDDSTCDALAGPPCS